MRRFKKIIIFIVSALLLLEVFYIVKNKFYKPVDLKVLADEVFSKCVKAPFAPSCYDEEIPKLMDKISMEEAFQVTKYVQEKDPKYLYCHVLAHKLSFIETSKDLSKWKDVITRCPTTMCNNGCQHGSLMRKFNAESLNDEQIKNLMPDLKNVCEPRGKWNPVEVERSMCYHALGHLNMFITNADINKSVNICNEIAKKDDGRNYHQTCTSGVLMSVFQPLEPEDFKLVKDLTPKKEDVDKFCSQFTGESFDACHREAWPLFLEDIKNPEQLVKFCSYSKDQTSQNSCIGTAMNILTIYLVIDNEQKLDKLDKFCRQLPSKYQKSCYQDSAVRLIQIDPSYGKKSIEICTLAGGLGFSKDCFEMLLYNTTYFYHEGTQEQKKYCSLFPKEYQDTCLKKKNTDFIIR